MYALLVSALLVLGGCSQAAAPPEPAGQQTATGATGTATTPEDAPEATALSGLEEAEEAASGWREDARLYAIATATPNLTPDGEAPVWLYSYVSPSAGAVVSVSVAGGEATLMSGQPLPEKEIENIARNALPPAGKLVDSSEAIEHAGEVRTALEENPGAEATAGLDSFSTGSPAWIFATTGGGGRIEERITAVR